jgi:excisionase family DNA binding protein
VYRERRPLCFLQTDAQHMVVCEKSSADMCETPVQYPLTAIDSYRPFGRMMSVTELERFLTVEEIAGRLQVSDQTVRRWVKSGKLAAFKPGKELRIRPRDLEEFLEARKVRPDERGRV